MNDFIDRFSLRNEINEYLAAQMEGVDEEWPWVWQFYDGLRGTVRLPVGPAATALALKYGCNESRNR